MVDKRFGERKSGGHAAAFSGYELYTRNEHRY